MLFPREHRDEAFDRSRPRGGRAGVLDPVEDRVAVLAREDVEHRPRLWLAVEGGGEVVGHLGGRGPGVSLLPAAVRAGALHSLEAGGLHAPLCQQPLDDPDVARGPG